MRSAVGGIGKEEKEGKKGKEKPESRSDLFPSAILGDEKRRRDKDNMARLAICWCSWVYACETTNWATLSWTREPSALPIARSLQHVSYSDVAAPAPTARAPLCDRPSCASPLNVKPSTHLTHLVHMYPASRTSRIDHKRVLNERSLNTFRIHRSDSILSLHLAFASGSLKRVGMNDRFLSDRRSQVDHCSLWSGFRRERRCTTTGRRRRGQRRDDRRRTILPGRFVQHRTRLVAYVAYDAVPPISWPEQPNDSQQPDSEQTEPFPAPAARYDHVSRSAYRRGAGNGRSWQDPRSGFGRRGRGRIVGGREEETQLSSSCRAAWDSSQLKTLYAPSVSVSVSVVVVTAAAEETVRMSKQSAALGVCEIQTFLTRVVTRGRNLVRARAGQRGYGATCGRASPRGTGVVVGVGVGGRGGRRGR